MNRKLCQEAIYGVGVESLILVEQISFYENIEGTSLQIKPFRVNKYKHQIITY